MADTTVMIYGAVGDDWAGLDAATLVPQIDAAPGNITLAINSPGGLIMEGLAIFNALARAQAGGKTITCRIDGLAASMASVLAMAGDVIVMAPNAMLMIHNPWDVACGDAEDLRNAADQLDRLKATIVNIYAARTGMSADALSTMMDDETWMDAATALAQGFCTTIGTAASASNAVAITKFGFRKAPDHQFIAGSAMALAHRASPPIPPKDPILMTEPTPAAANPSAMNETSVAAITAAALASERTRTAAIRDLGAKHRIDNATINGLIDGGVAVDAARETILETLAARNEGDRAGAPGGAITITVDERDKWMQGAANWLIVRSGMASAVRKAAQARGEKIDLAPGEFAGITLRDLAREALVRNGAKNISRDPAQYIGEAFTARGAISQGAGDFPILLENTMHKVLQAAYQITPDTWSRFCGTGTVTDFRPSNRYLRGTFSSLDTLTDQGEFINKGIPDGEKQQISAGTKGNIISLSRQAIINDDMGAFITLASDLGRAAKLTIEKDVYALLASNPVMYDGAALFSNAHRNLAGGSWTLPGGGSCPAAALIGVSAFDLARVAMASQLDPSGNEILDIRPETLLCALTDEGSARVIIGSKYDVEVSGKYEVPNKVQGLVSDVVGSARLNAGTSGHGWYFFADKEMAPAIEVVFLNGIEEPFLDNSLGWRVDGTEFKVRLDYGTGAINWRSAFYNPGT
jgi:ATP-dependent Clp endopeptidase proteolytic subunit ClpP